MRADEFGRVEGREKIWEKWGDSLKRLENSGTGRITLYNYHFYREEILWNYILRSSTTRLYGNLRSTGYPANCRLSSKAHWASFLPCRYYVAEDYYWNGGNPEYRPGLRLSF